jgi:hypothetical protein
MSEGSVTLLSETRHAVRAKVAVERYAFDAQLAAAFFSAVRRGIFVEP